MKKLSTEIIRKNGEIRTITVEVEDIYADWLLTQPKEIYHDAVLFEYRTSCVERKETRYIQSLDASMDNGFDVADESVESVEQILTRLTIEQAVSTLSEEQKWLVNQIYYFGRTRMSVADELGITEGAIRSRLSVISKKLEKILKNF